MCWAISASLVTYKVQFYVRSYAQINSGVRHYGLVEAGEPTQHRWWTSQVCDGKVPALLGIQGFSKLLLSLWPSRSSRGSRRVFPASPTTPQHRHRSSQPKLLKTSWANILIPTHIAYMTLNKSLNLPSLSFLTYKRTISNISEWLQGSKEIMKAKCFFNSVCHRKSAQKTSIVIPLISSSSSSVLLYCILRDPTGSLLVTSSLWSQKTRIWRLSLLLPSCTSPGMRYLISYTLSFPICKMGSRIASTSWSFDEDLMNQWHKVLRVTAAFY